VSGDQFCEIRAAVGQPVDLTLGTVRISSSAPLGVLQPVCQLVL
jgi:hypothetical protein